MLQLTSRSIENHMERCGSVWERTWIAARGLADGTGTIQSRLAYAKLTLDPLLTRDFPEELQSTHATVMEELRDLYRPGVEGNCYLDVTNEEGRELAGKIFDLYQLVDSIRIVNLHMP